MEEQATATEPAAQNSRTRNLKRGGFVKGKSGNPGGRPKKDKSLAKLAMESSETALKKLIKLVNSDDDRVALAAAQAVLDRAVGKPKQSVDLDAKHKHDHGSESVSSTLDWIRATIREREDRQAPKLVPDGPVLLAGVCARPS